MIYLYIFSVVFHTCIQSTQAFAKSVTATEVHVSKVEIEMINKNWSVECFKMDQTSNRITLYADDMILFLLHNQKKSLSERTFLIFISFAVNC